MLKKTVPTSWIDGREPVDPPRLPRDEAEVPSLGAPGQADVLTTSRYWSVAALVKKIEPTKKVTPSAPTPTSDT